MKKLLAVLLLAFVVLWVGTPYAASVGTATATTKKVVIDGKQQRFVYTISVVGDASGNVSGQSVLSLNPATYGIEGWILYSVQTDPGSTAPAAAWDVAITDLYGIDVTGGTAGNRSASATEVAVPKRDGTNYGFPQILNTWTIGITNMTNSGATATIVLEFFSN